MATITREYIRYSQDGNVAATTEDKWNGPQPASGNKVQIKRITFADGGNGDLIAGKYKVDWGSGGDNNREILAEGYVTGTTIDLPMSRTFVGDGTSRIRIVRENFSILAREMICAVELIERSVS